MPSKPAWPILQGPSPGNVCGEVVGAEPKLAEQPSVAQGGHQVLQLTLERGRYGRYGPTEVPGQQAGGAVPRKARLRHEPHKTPAVVEEHEAVGRALGRAVLCDTAPRHEMLASNDDP